MNPTEQKHHKTALDRLESTMVETFEKLKGATANGMSELRTEILGVAQHEAHTDRIAHQRMDALNNELSSLKAEVTGMWAYIRRHDGTINYLRLRWTFRQRVRWMLTGEEP